MNTATGSAQQQSSASSAVPSVRLVSVYDTPGAEDTLYDLLAERTPEQSISHRQMPTRQEHHAFLWSLPYLGWWLVLCHDAVAGAYCGAIYLTRQREVGISIFRSCQGHGYGSAALAELRRLYPGPLLANINPANEASRRFFTRHGFRLVQHTYALQEGT